MWSEGEARGMNGENDGPTADAIRAEASRQGAKRSRHSPCAATTVIVCEKTGEHVANLVGRSADGTRSVPATLAGGCSRW